MENIKKYLIVAAISFVLGGFIVYNITGPESIEQTQTSETNKEKDKEKTDNDIITVVEEEIKPDGSKTKKTTVVDKSKKESESSKESTKETNQIKIVESTKDWIAGMTVSKNFKDLSQKEVYGIMMGKKIINTKKIDIYGIAEYKTNGIGSVGILGTF